MAGEEGPHAERIARLFPETHRRSGFGLSLSAERLEVSTDSPPSGRSWLLRDSMSSN